MKRNWKFKPKARQRAGKIMPLAAKGAVKWRNVPIKSGKAFRISKKEERS
jgi:hypothetical protein